jgi:hypothetical protein
VERELCRLEPADSIEHKPGGRCAGPHIESEEERTRREARCLNERLERFRSLRKEELDELGLPAPDISAGEYEAAAREFLGYAGFNPQAAEKLAKRGGGGNGAGPAIGALREASGVSTEEFQNFVNSLETREDLDKLGQFVDFALRLRPDANGAFPRRAPGARDALRVGPDAPALDDLFALGRELFGARFPGPDRLP